MILSPNGFYYLLFWLKTILLTQLQAALLKFFSLSICVKNKLLKNLSKNCRAIITKKISIIRRKIEYLKLKKLELIRYN